MLLQKLYEFSRPEESIEGFYVNRIPLFSGQRVLTLISQEVADSPDFSDKVREQAKKIVYEAKAVHVLYKEKLIALTTILNKHSIEYVLLKGASLWEYYTSSYLRDQEDIDVLVRTGELHRIIDILENENMSVGKTEFTPRHVAVYLTKSEFPDLEFHTSITLKGKFWISPETLFEHSHETEVEGTVLRVLETPFNFLHSILHAANHHLLSRIQWLNDVRLMAERRNGCELPSPLNGSQKRACFAVLHYSNILFNCDSLSEIERTIGVSSLFKIILKEIVPENRIFDNPVLISRFRQYLYNVLLIQNPVNIAKVAWCKFTESAE